MKRRVRMIDVVKIADVSIVTVSRVLNGSLHAPQRRIGRLRSRRWRGCATNLVRRRVLHALRSINPNCSWPAAPRVHWEWVDRQTLLHSPR